jgi:hypothetical protein
MIVYTCRKQFYLELSSVTTEDKVVFCCVRDSEGSSFLQGTRGLGCRRH